MEALAACRLQPAWKDAKASGDIDLNTGLTNSLSNWAGDDPSVYTRQKRSLLPFVGDFHKQLFGTATEADVQLLRDALDHYQEAILANTDSITQMGQSFHSAVSATYNKTSAAIGNVAQELHQMKEVVKSSTKSQRKWIRTE